MSYLKFEDRGTTPSGKTRRWVVLNSVSGGRDGCKNPPSGEMHPCPYQEDINDEHEDYCFCCEDCQQECADDI